jgi:hypothetical protein
MSKLNRFPVGGTHEVDFPGKNTMESREFARFFVPEWRLRAVQHGPIIAVAQVACNRQDGRSLIEFHDSVGAQESLWAEYQSTVVSL